MPANFSPLSNGQAADATTFNAPLQELDDALEHLKAGLTPVSAVTCSGVVSTAGLRVDGDSGGLVGSLTLTDDITDTPTNPSTPAGWLKIYVGLTVAYLPYYT